MAFSAFFFLLFLSAAAAARSKPSNLTVMGTVFCDACASRSFSKHSFFLHGAKVRIDCSFKSAGPTKEEMTLSVERTTDRYGVYRVDVPPVDDFQCKEGRELQSSCRASLLLSSSSLCNVPGLSVSTEHVAVACEPVNACVYNLNALFFRPAKPDAAVCGGAIKSTVGKGHETASLFFWPPFPPFGLPWPFPHWPPLPFPFPFPFPWPAAPPSPPSFRWPFSPPPPPPGFSLPWPFSPPPGFSFPWPLSPPPPPPSPPPPAPFFWFPLPPFFSSPQPAAAPPPP